MYLKNKVIEKIVRQIESLERVANYEINENKRKIKKLVLEQAILKRSRKCYNDLLYSIVKNK
jgi:hypothetical protein